MVTNKQFRDAVAHADSYSSVCRTLSLPINGTTMRRIRSRISKLKLSTKHFDGGRARSRRYPYVKKQCPVCGKVFHTSVGTRDEKTVCSHACSNTFFRSGQNNGNYNGKHYRGVCFRAHGHACLVCGEHKIVAVHHIDRNHENNDPANLAPLCPTHHQYLHSRYAAEIQPVIAAHVHTYISAQFSSQEQKGST
jgi:hypothetical protein